MALGKSLVTKVETLGNDEYTVMFKNAYDLDDPNIEVTREITGWPRWVTLSALMLEWWIYSAVND